MPGVVQATPSGIPAAMTTATCPLRVALSQTGTNRNSALLVIAPATGSLPAASLTLTLFAPVFEPTPKIVPSVVPTRREVPFSLLMSLLEATNIGLTLPAGRTPDER